MISSCETVTFATECMCEFFVTPSPSLFPSEAITMWTGLTMFPLLSLLQPPQSSSSQTQCPRGSLSDATTAALNPGRSVMQRALLVNANRPLELYQTSINILSTPLALQCFSFLGNKFVAWKKIQSHYNSCISQYPCVCMHSACLYGIYNYTDLALLCFQ